MTLTLSLEFTSVNKDVSSEIDLLSQQVERIIHERQNPFSLKKYKLSVIENKNISSIQLIFTLNPALNRELLAEFIAIVKETIEDMSSFSFSIIRCSDSKFLSDFKQYIKLGS